MGGAIAWAPPSEAVLFAPLVTKHATLIVAGRNTIARKKLSYEYSAKARPSPAGGQRIFASRQCFIQYPGPVDIPI
jgi:hypothetical protein